MYHGVFGVCPLVKVWPDHRPVGFLLGSRYLTALSAHVGVTHRHWSSVMYWRGLFLWVSSTGSHAGQFLTRNSWHFVVRNCVWKNIKTSAGFSLCTRSLGDVSKVDPTRRPCTCPLVPGLSWNTLKRVTRWLSERFELWRPERPPSRPAGHREEASRKGTEFCNGHRHLSRGALVLVAGGDWVVRLQRQLRGFDVWQHQSFHVAPLTFETFLALRDLDWRNEWPSGAKRPLVSVFREKCLSSLYATRGIVLNYALNEFKVVASMEAKPTVPRSAA